MVACAVAQSPLPAKPAAAPDMTPPPRKPATAAMIAAAATPPPKPAVAAGPTADIVAVTTGAKPALAAAGATAAPSRGSTGADATAAPRGRLRLGLSLGLGPAERVLPGQEEEGNNGEDEEEEEVHSCEEGDQEEEDDGEQKGRLSTTMATSASCPLSPIQEGESVEEATCESAPHTADTHASVPPPGSTAPTPRRDAPRSSVCTPRSACRDNNLSFDSEAPTPSMIPPDNSRATPSASSKPCKSIVVNGTSYAQIRTIGRGGSSKVYLVRTPSGEAVALKRVVTDSPKQLENFMTEVDLLMRLRGQECVIQVIDSEVDRERGRILIVMELGDVTLGEFLQSETKLSLSKVQSIWRQMLEAVQVIHDARIVHSDLKPANFVMVRDRLKVIDFGIAKPISNDTTNISRDFSVGTLSYMAPEAVRTQSGTFKHGRASDIWALGIILYQMVYMQPPFAHLEPMQRVQMLSSPDLKIEFPEGHCLDSHSSTTRAHLTNTLAGCLQRDPKRRLSLPDLLAHPLLRSAVEVQREVLESTVASMMGCVLRTLGEAPESEGDVPGEKWQALADEVFEHASSSTAPSKAADFEGLAPLSAVASRVASLRRERDAALAEARRQEAKNAELQEQLRQMQEGAPLPSRNRSAPVTVLAPKGHQRQAEKENVRAVCNNGAKSAEGKPGSRDNNVPARSWMHNT